MWGKLALNEVTTIINGGTPKSGVANYWNGSVPWITPKDMGSTNSVEVTKTSRTISEQGLQKSSAKLVPENSVILSTRAPIGHLVINKVPMAFNQGCRGLCPHPKLDTKFLFYFLKANVKLLDNLGTGTTFKELSKSALAAIEIPLPPLSEQKRIVAILDEAFEGIDAAIANTQANLAAARELFEGYLSRVFNDLNETSEETIIGDQLVLQRGFDITKKQQRPGTIPVVSSGGIKSYHDTAMVNGPGVVIGRKGSLGTVHFVEGPYWPHDTTLWVKDFKGNIPKIIYYFFRSLDVSGLDSGAANPALNRNAVHPIRTRWPKLAHQHTLLNNIERIDKDTERLETLYQQKLTALHELKQSILAKAFRGELTQNEVAA
ncbi:restriction endonuclease subunit S [uncultured Thalassospira sp.]|uniref:restriction endonuclease subunit S n=1 Tax=uncultured Thalassospira sp. TaxID=404382 RepID=UPI0030D93640|tara:strand:- start:3492 stop:4619 length:1128 start_codon:yes stop_codon:yes gene_type:complete